MLRLKFEAKMEHREGPHTIQSFWPFPPQASSGVKNMSDDMLYMALAIVCKKRLGEES
jgi:hypothetical protein